VVCVCACVCVRACVGVKVGDWEKMADARKRGTVFCWEIHSSWGFFLNLAPNMWGNRKNENLLYSIYHSMWVCDILYEMFLCVHNFKHGNGITLLVNF
jgi:hypothetical protein